MPAAVPKPIYGACLGGGIAAGSMSDFGVPIYGSVLGGGLASGYSPDIATVLYGAALGGGLAGTEAQVSSVPIIFDVTIYGGVLGGLLAVGRGVFDRFEVPIYFDEHDEHTSGGPSCELTGGSVEHDEHSGS